jgi:putative membrane-bound dehydrogenase-like protein
MILRLFIFVLCWMSWPSWAAELRPERLDEVDILKHLRSNPVDASNSSGEKAATINQIYLPEGFKAELVAAEPDIVQPIAFTFDELGRLWVVEALSYPAKRPEGEGKDRVVILEDYDGDGSFEKRTVFTEGLNLVSGIEVGYGGVWIGAAPQLLFIPDADQDDKPDGPVQVLLDGFGFQDTHETLNSFIWGPDGWLYGNQGVFNYSQIGKPGAPVEERTAMRAGVWRYHPVHHRFEVYAHGGSNQWGLDYDHHGQWFMTHCRSYWGKGLTTHVVRGGHYWNQANAHYPDYIEPYPPDELSHFRNFLLASARYGHGEGGAGASGTRRVYGGHSHIGTMLYQGDNWPSEYRDRLYTHNLHGHQMNVQVNERDGSAYNTVHAGQDFLFCSDPRYIAIDLKYGPDGAVYINDWYDTQHCHNPNSEQWDRSNGRVYRVQYDRTFKPVLVNLSNKSDRDLAWMQLHQNAWYARTARRLLHERAQKGVITEEALDVLRTMSLEHADVNRRLRALWALYVCGGIGDRDWNAYLGDESEYIRAGAVELLTSLEQAPLSPLGQLILLAQSDPSSFVRLRLASAAMRLSGEPAWELLEVLIRHTEDARDRYVPSMIWFAVAQKMPNNLDRVFQWIEQEGQVIPVLKDYIVWYAAKLKGAALDRAITHLDRSRAEDRGRLMGAIHLALRNESRVPMPRGWASVASKLYRSSDDAVRLPAEKVSALFGDRTLLPKMRDMLVDKGSSLEERMHALEILNKSGDESSVPLFIGLLDEAEFQTQAINLLARFDHPDSAAALLERLPRFEGKDKVAAFNTLTARTSLAVPLLDAVMAEEVDRDLLTAFYLRQLQQLNAPSVNDRIGQIWGTITQTSEEKAAKMDALQHIFSEAPLWAYSANEGKQHFQLLCSTCHRVNGEGTAIGPDLDGAGSSGSRYFLENIIDPNAVIGQNYQVTEIERTDGETISGLFVSESETGVVLRTLTDNISIDKNAIATRKLATHSMMPEGLLDGLNERQVIELLKYLGSL